MTGGWRKSEFRERHIVSDDFSITVMRLSHRDYTDDAGDAIFNRKRVRENNSRGSVRRSVCLRKLPRGLNGKCVSILRREIDRRPFRPE